MVEFHGTDREGSFEYRKEFCFGQPKTGTASYGVNPSLQPDAGHGKRCIASIE
jgi:hypothetical protein